MKKIIVVGYNDFSRKVVSKIKSVEVILDDLTNDKSYNGIKIDRISNVNNYKNCEIYVIDDMPYFDEIYHKLYYCGINKINVIVKEENDIVDNNILNNKHVYYLKNKPVLRYIETHISDKCNLKCNGCTHFSNIAEKDFVEFESFKKDIDLLSEKFNATIIRLMGGEPLLKKDIDKYISYIRSKFKESTIFIVSNGLLIKTISDKILDCFRNNNIIINISLYKPTVCIANEIDEFLTNKGIKHRFGKGNLKPLEEDYILKFHTCLDTVKESRNGKLNCYNQYCWFLRDGKIYKCPYPALIKIINNRYHLNFEVKNDFVNIKKIKDGWSIIKRLSQKIDFCDYCKNRVKEYEWNSGAPELDYYLLGGKNGNIKD